MVTTTENNKLTVLRLDKTLVDEILSGDRNSFTVLYNKYQVPLFAICMRYARDYLMAEDFFQEAMIKIYKNLDKYDENKGEYLTWASRVTINTCLNHARKWQFSKMSFGLEAIESPVTHNFAIENLSIKEMLEIINVLPDGYRVVFNMYVMDGYSHAEIASTLGISVGTSKSQLSRAKRHIAEQIDNRYFWSKTS